MEPTKQSIRKHTKRNFREITSSCTCGCLSCLRIFKPDKIVEWKGHSSTAVCPYCEDTQLIGSASGYPITEEQLLQLAATSQTSPQTKQVSSKYRSAFSLPSVLDKSIAFRDLSESK